MKKKMILGILFVLSIIAFEPASTEAQFCWKGSYKRGSGHFPDGCGDHQKIAGICYKNCTSGMKRVGVNCQSICPNDMRDDGLFCRKDAAEYERRGYKREWSDTIYPDLLQLRRCEYDHGVGNCEKLGDVVYPKCKPECYVVSLVFCRPLVLDCKSLNLNESTNTTCGKKFELGKIIPYQCNSSEELHHGRCYQTCAVKYRGIGTHCWAEAQIGWIDCGMGASLTQQGCTELKTNQIQKIGQLAISVAAMGAPSAANVNQKAAMVTKIRSAALEMINIKVQMGKPGVHYILFKIVDNLNSIIKKLTKEDEEKIKEAIESCAQMTEFIDPIEVAGINATFINPKCPKPAWPLKKSKTYPGRKFH